jgi:putative membrane protein
MAGMSKVICRNAFVIAVAGAMSIAAAAQQSGNSSSPMSSPMSSAKNSKLSAADKHFVNEAAAGGMAEVELGQLATEKASSPDVKQFGQRMVNDHSKANDQLKRIAADEGVRLPAKLSAKDQATKNRLSKLSGDAFDKAYMADMVKDHKTDVAAFRNESKTGEDPQVKSFAADTLPTLEDHLKNAQKVAPTVERSAMEAPK